MGESGRDLRRITSRILATLAVSDVAYRLFMRAPLRRALGIEVGHA